MSAAIALMPVMIFFTIQTADETIRVTSRPDGSPAVGQSWGPAISADGTHVVLTHSDTALVPGLSTAWRQVLVWERSTRSFTCASRAPDGTPAEGSNVSPAISADGRYVVFGSTAANLVGFTGNGESAFLVDRETGAVTWASPTKDGFLNGSVYSPRISADGSRVAYFGNATDLVDPPLPGPESLAYVFDVATGVVSVASSESNGTRWQITTFDVWLSADGKFAAFEARSPHDFRDRAMRKDLVTGELEEIQVTNDGTPNPGQTLRGLSGDGQIVLFDTHAALVPEDTNGAKDVYVRDVAAGLTTLVSLGPDGTGLLVDSIGSWISGDGRYVWFTHVGGELFESDSTFVTDLFVRDRWLGTTLQMTKGTLDQQSADEMYVEHSCGSDDGSVAVFASYTADFTDDDQAGWLDVFVRERAMVDATRTHYGTGYPGRNGIPTIEPRTDPLRGATITLDISCSSGLWSVAFVLVGDQAASIPTRLGGEILVASILTLPVGLSPSGGVVDAFIPDEWQLLDSLWYVQVLELDPWASHGVSFTDGLELRVGDL